MPASTNHDSIFLLPEYHDLVGLIYDAVNHPEGFRPFMARFMEVFNGYSAALSIYDKKRQKGIGSWVINVPQHAMDYYTRHMADNDVLMQTAIQKSNRFIASNLDLDPVAQRSGIELGHKWLATYGASCAAGAVALQTDDYMQFFSVQRAPHQGDFTRQELAMFDLFLPHLNRAASLYSDFNNLQVSQLEKQALDQMQTGIIICDTSFKVAYYNHIAENILAEVHGMALDAAPFLIFQDNAFFSRFSSAMNKAMGASLQRKNISDEVLRYQNNNQSMTLVISPLKTSGENQQASGVMISLHDWSSRVVLDAQTLQQHFSLTTTEAEVGRRLAAGESLVEIAEGMNRSRETIRVHLRNLFRKTRTQRQGELISLLSTVSARS